MHELPPFHVSLSENVRQTRLRNSDTVNSNERRKLILVLNPHKDPKPGWLLEVREYQGSIGASKPKAVGHGHLDFLLLRLERNEVEANANIGIGQVKSGRHGPLEPQVSKWIDFNTAS